MGRGFGDAVRQLQQAIGTSNYIDGIAIGTAALIVILSVFNGFGDLITGMFGYFNPDIKIEVARGKFFEEN